MMKLFQSVKVSLRRNTSIKGAAKNGDTGPLVSFLSEYPEEGKNVAASAIDFCESGAPWNGLLLGVGLSESKSPYARQVLEKIAGISFPGWHRLDKNQVKPLLRYLQNENDKEILSGLLAHLQGGQLISILEDVENPRYLIFVNKYLDKLSSADLIKGMLVSYLEEVAFKPDLSDKEQLGIKNIYWSGVAIWDKGHVKEALEILNLISILQEDLISKDTLEKINQKILDFMPRTVTLVNPVTNTTEKVEQTKIPFEAIRSVNLLLKYPSLDWVKNLKLCWVMVDKIIRDRPTVNLEEIHSPTYISTFANLLVATLGVCASLDESNVSLTSESEEITKGEQEIDRLISIRNQKLVRHNDLVKDYKLIKGSNNEKTKFIENEIRLLNSEISDLNDSLEAINLEVKKGRTPAALLLRILGDGRSYSDDIRQGTAWGLYKLATQGHLEEKSSNIIKESIRYALYADIKEEGEIQESLSQYLPENEELRQNIMEAVMAHNSRPNIKALNTKLGQMLSDEDKNNLIKVIEVLNPGNSSYEFRERFLQLLPEHQMLELEQILGHGLQWMIDLKAEEHDQEDIKKLYQNLRWVLNLTYELVPKAFEFLSKYPLRLMTLEQHKTVLGQYSHTGCGVGEWTNFTPPIWKKGAKPEDIGVVNRRYLRIEDRSLPNSMGIYYRLFEHPVLCLPVIYHESLHYGGPTGDPKKGIKNETDVLIREILFTRYLIAKMAPSDDSALPDFEIELAETLKKANIDGKASLITRNFQDDRILNSLCDAIENIYGEQFTENESSAYIDELITNRNKDITLKNRTDEMKLDWCPEIDWPTLDSEESEELTNRYRRVLKDNLETSHRISSSHRDGILNDETCRVFISEWERYRRRPNSLQNLTQGLRS